MRQIWRCVTTRLSGTLRPLWAQWDRFVGAVGDRTDRVMDGIGDGAEALRQRVRGAWSGARDQQCDACGRTGQLGRPLYYLTPTPFGIARRCDACRAMWHRAIKELYALRVAEVAAARYEIEGQNPPAPPFDKGGMGRLKEAA